MDFRTRRKAEEQLLDLVPLIDVVLTLLLFFMVTTEFITTPGLKVTLPGIEPGSTATASNKLQVKVTATGDIFVDGIPVSQDHLADVIRQSALDPESAVVVLMADESLTHGRVVEIMDLIRREGLRRVVLAARWKTKEGAS
jgi:biopolymer transport protein ExbD